MTEPMSRIDSGLELGRGYGKRCERCSPGRKRRTVPTKDREFAPSMPPPLELSRRRGRPHYRLTNEKQPPQKNGLDSAAITAVPAEAIAQRKRIVSTYRRQLVDPPLAYVTFYGAVSLPARRALRVRSSLGLYNRAVALGSSVEPSARETRPTNACVCFIDVFLSGRLSKSMRQEKLRARVLFGERMARQYGTRRAINYAVALAQPKGVAYLDRFRLPHSAGPSVILRALYDL